MPRFHRSLRPLPFPRLFSLNGISKRKTASKIYFNFQLRVNFDLNLLAPYGIKRLQLDQAATSIGLLNCTRDGEFFQTYLDTRVTNERRHVLPNSQIASSKLLKLSKKIVEISKKWPLNNENHCKPLKTAGF